jgi:hypothetical protein
MQTKLRRGTYSFLGFVFVAAGLTVALALLFPPDAEDVRAAPELAGMLAGLFPGSLVGSVLARIFTTVGTPWVNRAVHPVILAHACGAGATGYVCYLLCTLYPIGSAWMLALAIYAVGGALLAGLLLSLAGVTPLRRALRR